MKIIVSEVHVKRIPFDMKTTKMSIVYELIYDYKRREECWNRTNLA